MKKITTSDIAIYAATIMDVLPSAILITNENGDIIFCNQRVQELFGYPVDEAMIKNIEELIPKSIERFYQNSKDTSIGLELKNSSFAMHDIFGLRQDSSFFPIELHWKPILLQNESFLLASVYDVSFQTKDKESLQEYRHFFYNSNDMACVANMLGYFEKINAKFVDLLGYSEKELLENQFLAFIHPDDFQITVDEIKKLESGADTINFTNRYRKQNGEYLWFSWNAKPEKETGKIYAIARDITNAKLREDMLQKKHQELEMKNKEIEQFVYIASHDLQEPLRTVSNYVQIIKEDYKGRLDEKEEQFLWAIDKATQRMRILVKALLDYSRLGKNRVLSMVDCNVLVKEVIADLENLIHSTNAIITVEPLPVLNVYETEFRQLFQNLIINAIKFRKADEPIRIVVKADFIENKWKFSVKDNGIGIHPEHYDRIFLIFQQLDTTGQIEGHGIGLANCKKIVEIHLGSISVESEPDKGSTFYFTLPILNL